MRLHPAILVLFAVACGDSTPPPVAPAPARTVPGASLPPATPKLAGLRVPNIGSVARSASRQRERRPAFESDSAPRPRGSMGSSDYDAIGPATVLIDDGNGGSGSGVIIGADGYVLTNYHVIAGGNREGLHIGVTVQLGKLEAPAGETAQKGANGGSNLVMGKSGDPLKAWVHAFDTLNDVAILKIVPPAGQTLKLPALTISEKDAQLGSVVHCMGHPAIGGLWTLREGKVESVRDDVDLLSRAPSKDPDHKKMVETIRTFESANTSGRLLQVGCAFVHGESGGPEVDASNQIVAINRRYDVDDAGHTRFGVPASAIRRLAANVSPTPVDVIPDPWRDGGQLAELSDASLDGVPETLAIRGFDFGEGKPEVDRTAFIVDVGQKSFNGAPGEIADIRKARSLKSRFAMVTESISGNTFTTYDTDGDGKTDIVFKRDRDRRQTTAYRMSAAGAKEDASLGRNMFVPSLFTDATEKSRFEAVLASLGVGRRESAPDALHGAGSPVELQDRDGDGQSDSLSLGGPFSSGVVVDASQSFLGKWKPGFDDAKGLSLDGAKLDVSVIETPDDDPWIYLARQKAGTLDTRVRFSDYPNGSVTSVESTDGSAAPTDFLGRKLLRPGTLSPAGWARISKMSMNRMLVGADDGLGSFPTLTEDLSEAGKATRKGLEKKIVITMGRETTSILVDVDGDTWTGKKNDVSVLDLVRKGEIKAELTQINRGASGWVFYDTDKDGKMDLVLFASDIASGRSTVAYRIDKAGNVTVDPSVAPGPMIRPSLFKGAVAGQLKALLKATPVFPSAELETAH